MSGRRTLSSYIFFSCPGLQSPIFRRGLAQRTLTSYIIFSCPGLQSPIFRSPDLSGRRTLTSYIFFSCPGLQSGEEEDHEIKGFSPISSVTLPFRNSDNCLFINIIPGRYRRGQGIGAPRIILTRHRSYQIKTESTDKKKGRLSLIPEAAFSFTDRPADVGY